MSRAGRHSQEAVWGALAAGAVALAVYQALVPGHQLAQLASPGAPHVVAGAPRSAATGRAAGPSPSATARSTGGGAAALTGTGSSSAGTPMSPGSPSTGSGAGGAGPSPTPTPSPPVIAVVVTVGPVPRPLVVSAAVSLPAASAPPFPGVISAVDGLLGG